MTTTTFLKLTVLILTVLLPAGAESATIIVSQDSRARPSEPTLSGTNSNDLAVGPIASGDYFRTYLTFDLTSAAAASDVSLFLTNDTSNENNSSSLSQVFTLFQVASNWSGQAQPGPLGTSLATINITPSTGNATQNVSFNSPALTSAFNAALGGNFYLGIRSDAEGVDARSFLWLNSLEGGSNSPAQLVSVQSPEIAVSGNSLDIVDGDSTPSLADFTDFGTTTVGSPIQHTFRVDNTGTAALTTSGLTLPFGFSLFEGLDSSIAAGGFDTFTVQLDAALAGLYSGEISFANNDANENPFNFVIAGEVTLVPEPHSIAMFSIALIGVFGVVWTIRG